MTLQVPEFDRRSVFAAAFDCVRSQLNSASAVTPEEYGSTPVMTSAVKRRGCES